jgi:sugar-specific transcriptional regulator TrmB
MQISTQQLLARAGLEEKSAEVYLILLEHGESTMDEILLHTPLSRTTVYDVLPELMASEYVSYKKDGRNALYSAVHPNKLFSLVEEKKREVSLLENEMSSTIQSLAGTFQLANNKPGVRFFEGEEEIETALMRTLSPGTEILTFVHGKNIDTYIPNINKRYITARIQKQLHKRIISSDTPHVARPVDELRNAYTEKKFIDESSYPFDASVQIYGDAVLYLTITAEQKTGFIIEDPVIAQFHKSLFEFIWDKSE